MGWGKGIKVDLEDVRHFVESPKFTRFLMGNTTKFGTAAFIMQTLLDELDRLQSPKEKQNGNEPV